MITGYAKLRYLLRMKFKYLSSIILISVLFTGCSKAPGALLPAVSPVNAYYPDRFSSISALEGFGVGESAPNFRYLDSGGQPESISDFQGKAILLNFWSSRCPPCRDEMPILDRVYSNQSWQDKGLAVLTVNLDEDSGAAVQFIQDSHYSFPFVLDSKSVIGNAYGVFEYPSTFLIDKKGIIQYRKEGPFTSDADLQKALEKLIN
jgi:peroxiredoxin